jgi:hypothetical protein
MARATPAGASSPGEGRSGGERGAYVPVVREGLAASEAGKALQEHAKVDPKKQEERRDRTISVIEAVLLAVVAILTAYSGWAAAKWSTASSLSLARANSARAEANSANLDALNDLNFDVTAFDTWFTAFVAGDASSMSIAAKRFSPNLHRAFDAWLATNPATNPNAPAGPTYMPQYKQPAKAQAISLNAEATALYADGQRAGGTSDDYIRATVYLATVLVLAGLGGHFKYRTIRYGLAGVGSVVLGVSVVVLATLPGPP